MMAKHVKNTVEKQLFHAMKNLQGSSLEDDNPGELVKKAMELDLQNKLDEFEVKMKLKASRYDMEMIVRQMEIFQKQLL